ncbi:MAG TPA: M23 family metallopeptidase, partial [Bryobacteraceae bacterium]|nr:M23 family metallopeptidase [Bryobacteraceae bacterium]
MNRLLFSYLIAVCLAPGQSLEGVWLGTLAEHGNSAPVLFIFSQSSQGGIHGEVVSVQRNVSHKFEVSRDGRVLRWQVPRINGNFEGTLSADGKLIEGVWSERAGRQPLRLARYNETSFSLPLGAEIDVFVPKPPTAVRAGGRFHLMYELHLTNWGASEVKVERLELTIHGEVAKLEGESLAGLFSSRSLHIGPKTRTAIILMFSSSRAPNEVRHQLVFKRPEQSNSVTVDCGEVIVSHDVVSLSPPVRGKNWVMNEGPDVASHHRTSLLALNGKITNAQRFAFDIYKAEDGIDQPEVRRTENRHYSSYGEEVTAVADATVVSVRDDIPDATPHGLTSPVPIDLQTVTGNHVVLDLGLGRYAMYAHLQAGLRVRVGDRVARGQVLGRIGNSGRTDAPHLHFHVADGPTMNAEGLPFVFDTFERAGKRYTN